MEQAIDIFGAILVGAALFAPLLYGIATLYGMQHKQFRPLIRVRRRNGERSVVVFGDEKVE